MNTIATLITTPDYSAIKAKQNAAWTRGNDTVAGTATQIVCEDLAEALDLRAGQAVLDVAAGNGSFSLAAARRWTDVVATDYVSRLLARGARRAAAEGHHVVSLVADAEQLPFGDNAFDVVGSVFGVMFAADQERAAAQMLRVCRRGGRIGLANWTPDGFMGELFRVIRHYMPLPQGRISPSLWGTRNRLLDLFGSGARDICVREKAFTFRYKTPTHWMADFRNNYGPVHQALETLTPELGDSLRCDLTGLISRHNTATDGTVVVPAHYLEVVVKRA